ncbi:MAG: DUF4157 domain-containing protein [Gammaproteobacteria bacterium]|nr:DUF4157 domain-containing protein [Gammaproteobacteria bacterium]
MHAFRSQAGAQGSFRGSSISKKSARAARPPGANALWHNIATGVLAPTNVSKTPGNQGLVQRLCAGCEEEQAAQSSGVQAKLNVGGANDRYEQEADAVATQVAGSAPAAAQHKSGLPGGAANLDPTGSRKPDLASVQNIIATPSAGAPLAAEVRSRVEPVLGADLSPVQVHNNPRAHDAAAAINARAFTHQNHIFLGAGQSDRDVSLLAHELTHTVQQGGVGQASRAGASESGTFSTSGASSRNSGPASSGPDNLKQAHSDSPSVQALFDTGCYRSSFAGVYETKRDFFFNRIGWVLIHPGECTSCEGQSVIDCCEPGDSYCAEE